MEKRLYSSKCPVCGGKMVMIKRTRRTRIMKCVKCGFKEERDNIPLHWAIKHLTTLKGKASNHQPTSSP